MMCPKCTGKTRVVGTSSATNVERFRKCTKCNYTFSTVEAIKFDDFWREYARDVHWQDNEKLTKK